MAKVALGKGLGALLNPKTNPEPVAEAGERVQMIPLPKIRPSPFQPRKRFEPEHLAELVESIRSQGIIQPLILRRAADEGFEIIAGERRWRAATEVGMAEVPAILRQATDQEVLEIALIENLQREDLNPIEEAEAFARLARDFHLRQEDIATKVGRSRAAVANSIRLLDLAPAIQAHVAQNRISVGHAKVLLTLKTHEEQILIADIVLRRSATVRATERLVQEHLSGNGHPRPSPSRTKSSDPTIAPVLPAISELESRLRLHFGTRVTLQHGEKKGSIEIEYYGDADLQRLLDLIGLAETED